MWSIHKRFAASEAQATTQAGAIDGGGTIGGIDFPSHTRAVAVRDCVVVFLNLDHGSQAAEAAQSAAAIKTAFRRTNNYQRILANSFDDLSKVDGFIGAAVVLAGFGV